MQKTTGAARVQRKGTKAKPFILPLILCVGAGEIITIVLSLFFALIYAIADLPAVVVNIFTFIGLIIGSLVTGYLCALAFRKERGLMSIICGLTTTLILVIMNLLFFREPITALSFGKYFAIIIATFLAAAFTTPPKSKSGKKKIKKR
jgi:putative membrane protein (TIGR04086 family)